MLRAMDPNDIPPPPRLSLSPRTDRALGTAAGCSVFLYGAVMVLLLLAGLLVVVFVVLAVRG